MGYDFHITRAADWVDSKRHPISAEEWLALIEADAEFEIFRENGEYFADWKNGAGWFDWADGEIYTKNPDRQTLSKMLEIAAHLKAKVQGDEGEDVSEADFEEMGTSSV